VLPVGNQFAKIKKYEELLLDLKLYIIHELYWGKFDVMIDYCYFFARCDVQCMSKRDTFEQ